MADEMKDEIAALRQRVAELEGEIERLRELIGTAIEIIDGIDDYDSQEIYYECDYQAVDVLRQALAGEEEGE